MDVNECDRSPCRNRGTCTNLRGSYRCACRPGYSGPDCETDVDDCTPSESFQGGLGMGSSWGAPTTSCQDSREWNWGPSQRLQGLGKGAGVAVRSWESRVGGAVGFWGVGLGAHLWGSPMPSQHMGFCAQQEMLLSRWGSQTRPLLLCHQTPLGRN